MSRGDRLASSKRVCGAVGATADDNDDDDAAAVVGGVRAGDDAGEPVGGDGGMRSVGTSRTGLVGRI